MKKFNYIFTGILLSAILLICNSCDDFLKQTPHDAISSGNAYMDIEDFDLAVNGVYESMRNEDYRGGFFLIVPDVMSDNLNLSYTGRQTWNEYFDFNFSSTTYGTAGFWFYAYNAILSTNEVISRLSEDVNPFIGTDDEETSKNILAEALALRAFIHFDLVRYYAKDIKAVSSTDLGVPYKLNPKVENTARNTVVDVYKNIDADISLALTNMTSSYNSSINYRINKKTVYAIKAKINFTEGKYQEAIDAAKQAITNTTSGVVDGNNITSYANFIDIWTTSMDNDEVLFRLAVISTDDELTGNMYGQGDVTNHKPEYVLSYSFNSLFTNNDIRTEAYTKLTSTSGVTQNSVWKYRGRTEETGRTDIPIIRTPEMYLTIAESYAELGSNDSQALLYLDYVRSHRYNSFSSGNETGDALLTAIQNERRLELAFEGDRFFEIKRQNLDISRDNKGDNADGSGVAANKQFISKSSPYFLLPIPQGEMDANDLMVNNKY